MPKTIKCVVKGKVIVPEDSTALPEGTEVVINLPSKLCWLRHAGVWRDQEGLDGIIEEIYKSRTIQGNEAKL
jgi:hypothetical protein